MLENRSKIAYCGYRKEWWGQIESLLSISGFRCIRGQGEDFVRIARDANLVVFDRYQGNLGLGQVANLITELTRQGFRVMVVGTNDSNQNNLFLEAGAVKVLRGWPKQEIFLGVVQNLLF